MIKRKKYVVDRKFQTKFVARTVLLIIGVLIISGFLAYFITVQVEMNSPVKLYGATNTYQDDISTVSRIEVVRPVIIRSIIIGGTTGVIIAAVVMFFYSHRLAGPMYRLQKHLEDVSEGNLETELKFRNKDEFKQIADTVNILQNKLKKKGAV